MKTLIVKLDIGKPLSINHKLIPARGRLIKSGEYRKYEKKLDEEFAKWFDHVSVLGSGYDEKKHALKATWRIYVPENEFFTKKGTISKTCLDVTNSIKVMEDRLVHILGVDDSQFIEVTSEKIPTSGAFWCVCLELSIVMRPAVVRL